jgi:hypothetical protein
MAERKEPSDLEKFFSLFKGNETFYVKHKTPFTEDESGKVKASWVGVDKNHAKEPVPPTIEKYKAHLLGHEGLAIEPLRSDNTCFFAAIDIDVHGIIYTSLVQKLYEHGLKFAPCVSKSGGLHIYFFFQDKESGKKVVESLAKIVEVFGLNRLYTNDKGKSRVEIFPKHAVLPTDSSGSCLFLPFYNAANPKECRQKMITSEGKLIGLSKAIALIEGMFTSTKEIDKTLSELPYSDAPFCVQMITLTGALGEGDGRNDFIYQAGIYLKKKQKENFLPDMLMMNAQLAEPQPEKDVVATYTSVLSKQMEYKCKTGVCAEYCDTKLCKQREYGVGKDKGNRFTGFAAWGEISRVMADEPYYLWKVQVEEGGPWKDIRIDGESDLMNELVVARSCVRCVNRSPMIVRANDWIAIVNQSLVGIESRTIEIPKSTDTTEMSALHRYLIRYLTHRQIQRGNPILVQVGQVYHAQGFYYFTTDGFKDYLRIQKFTLGRINLREELTRFGCSDGSVTYKAASGEKSFSCWKKAEDEELLGMGSFYEDMAESDKASVAANPLVKVDTSFDKEKGDGEYRF